jgi:hypothetical protein
VPPRDRPVSLRAIRRAAEILMDELEAGLSEKQRTN